MRNILSGLVIALALSAPALAAELSPEAPMSLAQLSGGISGRIGGEVGGPVRNRTDDRNRQPQRFLCVMGGGNRSGPSSCTVYFGPVGSSCRCQNATGNGRIQAN